ncbi:MAG: hypothetical protein VB108_02525 [Anaerolineaceae bacterium]|nr:hypothetical protein [Anaerolineaceae bacterium]
MMCALASQEAAQMLLTEISRRFKASALPGYRALICIGSFAGGSFVAGRSDLDLVVLFSGKQPDEAETLRQTKELQDMIADLPSHEEVEILPRYDSDLAADPKSGLYAHADLIARLKVQAKLLDGSFDAQALRMPGPKDFRAEFVKEFGPAFERLETLPATEAALGAKFLFLALRYWLAIRRNRLVYHKSALTEAYRQAKPESALPTELENLAQNYLTGKATAKGYPEALGPFCLQLAREISSFQE